MSVVDLSVFVSSDVLLPEVSVWLGGVVLVLLESPEPPSDEEVPAPPPVALTVIIALQV